MRKTRGWLLTLLMLVSFHQDCYSMGGGMFGSSRKSKTPTQKSPTSRSVMPPKTQPLPPSSPPPSGETAPVDVSQDQSSSQSEGGGEGGVDFQAAPSDTPVPASKKRKKGKAAQEDVPPDSGGEKPADENPPPSEPVVATDTDPAKIQAMHLFQKTKLDAMRCLCEEAMFYSKRGEVNIKTAPPGVTLEQEKKYARDNYSNAMGLMSEMLGDTQELTAAIAHMKKQKEDADLSKPDFCSIPKTDPAAPSAEWNYKIHGEWKDKDEQGKSRSLGWKSKMALYARCISLSISGRNCAKHPKEKCAAKGGVASAMSSLKEKVIGSKDTSKEKRKKKKSPIGDIAKVAGTAASMTPMGMAANMATGGALSGGGAPTTASPARRSPFM